MCEHVRSRKKRIPLEANLLAARTDAYKPHLMESGCTAQQQRYNINAEKEPEKNR